MWHLVLLTFVFVHHLDLHILDMLKASAENEEGEEGVLCEESKSQEETHTTRSGRVVKMRVMYQG